MTELEALLAAILHRPADDNPRGAYADALDDAGEHEHAEFVRVQCELARLPDPNCLHCWPGNGCRYHELQRREGMLWFAVREAVAPITLHRALFGDDATMGGIACDENANAGYVVRRGFVDELRLSLSLFVGGECERCDGRGGEDRYPADDPTNRLMHDSHWYSCPDCTDGRVGLDLAAVFSRWPVTRVVFPGAEPRVGERDGEPAAYAWSYRRGSEGESFLPWELYRRLRGSKPDELLGTLMAVYPTRAAALDALSAACVAYGRSAAGLPAL